MRAADDRPLPRVGVRDVHASVQKLGVVAGGKPWLRQSPRNRHVAALQPLRLNGRRICTQRVNRELIVRSREFLPQRRYGIRCKRIERERHAWTSRIDTKWLPGRLETLDEKRCPANWRKSGARLERLAEPIGFDHHATQLAEVVLVILEVEA